MLNVLSACYAIWKQFSSQQQLKIWNQTKENEISECLFHGNKNVLTHMVYLIGTVKISLGGFFRPLLKQFTAGILPGNTVTLHCFLQPVTAVKQFWKKKEKWKEINPGYIYRFSEEKYTPGFWLDGVLAVEFEFAVSWRLRLRLECGLRLGSD